MMGAKMSDIHEIIGGARVPRDPIASAEDDALRQYTGPKVVPINGGAPALNDLPALLRAKADEIERGELDADTLYLVAPVEGDFPRLWAWGDIDGDNHPMVQLQYLIHRLSSMIMGR